MFSNFARLAITAFTMASFAWADKPLEVWIMPNGANPQGILEQRLSIFEKETGLKTKVVVLDWGEAWSRISNTLETGKNGPAVLQLGTTWVSYFASKGELAKLDPYLSEINPSRFTKVSWGTTGTDEDSSVYSVPWFVDARAILGNKAFLKLAGIKASDIATYEGFYKTLKRLKAMNLKRADGTPVSTYAFPGKSDWNIPHNFAPWIWSSGGNFIKKDANGKWRSNLLDPKTIKGIASYLNFILDSLVDKASLRDNTAQIAQKFNNGELVFILNTAEIVMQTRYAESEGGLSTAKIGQDSVAVFPVPAGSAGSICFVGGSNLAIPKAMENNANARKLLEFLTRDDNLDAYTRQIGFLPPVNTVLKSWAEDSAYKVLVEHLENGRSYPNIPQWTEVESSLIGLFSDIWGFMDIGDLYSEESMYNTIVTYNQKINEILKNSPDSSKIISLDEFKTIWESNIHEPESSSAIPESSDSGNFFSSELRLTVFVFIIAVLFGFFITFFRKRKGH